MPEKGKLFRLPEYDIAEMRFVHEGIRELMNAQDGFFSSIQKVEFGEAPYVNQNTLASGEIVQSQPVEMESPIELTFDQIRTFDVDRLASEMNAIAAKHLEIVMTHMFQQIGDLCAAAGNVVDAAGAPFSLDRILDMLERLEISFDESGQPQMPTLVMHPDMVAKIADLPPATPAQLERQAEIMETKRKEFYARSVIGSYLDTLSEREFDAPFLALLHLKGYTDIHFLHGSFEFGKDFIAKALVKGVLTQFVFQSKAGNINLGAWSEIRGQIDMLRTTTLSHPNFDAGLPRAARLVITGRLVGAAALAAQDYKAHLIALQEPVLFETWDRDTLLEDLDKSPEALGSSSTELLRLLGTTAFKITQEELERFSRQWMHVQSTTALLRDVLEAAVLASHLVRVDRLDLACFCALNLLRGVLATIHGTESLSQLERVALETAMDMFRFYAGKLWSESVGKFLAPDEMFTGSFPAGFVSYRVRCAIQSEMLGLYALLCVNRDLCKANEIADYLAKFFEANVGGAQPVSDRYAASLVPPLLLLWRTGHHLRVKAVLEEAAI